MEVTGFSLGLSAPALPLPSLWGARVFLVTSAPLAELAPGRQLLLFKVIAVSAPFIPGLG